MHRLSISVLSPLTQDYCASKFGVVGFHESLSHELKAAEKDGIKTTLVCPYLVDTGMFRGCRIRSVGTVFLLIQQSNIGNAWGYLSPAGLALSLSVDGQHQPSAPTHVGDPLALLERQGQENCHKSETGQGLIMRPSYREGRGTSL